MPRPDLSGEDVERLRTQALDDLRKCEALRTFWGRQLTGRQVQAELERIFAGSKDWKLLAEMVAVLDGDPDRVASAIAMPALADRLVRSWYAFDGRFHGALGEDARRARELLKDVAMMKELGGRYRVEQLERVMDGLPRSPHGLDPGAWSNEMSVLEGLFRSDIQRSRSTGGPPVGVVSPVHEDESRFFVVAVLSLDENEARVAWVEWPKVGFDAWWSQVAPEIEPRPPDIGHGFRLPVLNLSACTDDTWTPTHVGTPAGRYRHTAVWTGTEMIIWGGTRSGTGGFYASGGRYNPATDTWSSTSEIGAPSARYSHTAVWTGTEMIVWGGGTVGTWSDNGGRYDPVTDTWTPTSTAGAPEDRGGHVAVWTGTEMIVWGGFRGSPVVRLNTGGRYTPGSDSWQPTSTTDAPSPRSTPVAVWAGAANAMVVWGGFDGGSLDTGGRYYPGTDGWLPTTTTDAPTPRYQHAACWSGSRMIVWGGGGNTGGRYDPVGDAWVATTTTDAPPGANNPAAVWSGSRMIVWGGYSGGWLNSGGQYDPVGDAWQLTTTSGAPSGRRYHTAIWDGVTMIVWGGTSAGSGGENSGGRYHDGDVWLPPPKIDTPRGAASHATVWTGVEMIEWGGVGPLGEGSRYTPATDSWQATSTTGAPSARSAATAVWTGSEMVVWGGEDIAGPASTGGRYNPALDAWQPTSMTDAPAGRWFHTATWTGSQMVVWGGTDGTSYFDTGGRLDPSSGPWQPTSTSNAPAGREYHTAAWTGSAVVVLGGDNGAAALDGGGRYYPASDTWQPVALSGTPRAGHVGAWTGTEAIVWGGWDGVTYVDTGGRYDPVVDAWQAMSTPSAPSPRVLATGTWTSQELVVWGGWSGVTSLGDGGRYEPASDLWLMPTSNVGAPSARYRHSAVWTGDRMIVWGGYDPGVTNTGGLYCACSTPDTTGWNHLRATKGATTVDLAWPPGWPGVAGYNVYRDAVPNSPWGAAQRIGGPLQATSFQDTPPAAPVTYYLIKAIGSCGDEMP